MDNDPTTTRLQFPIGIQDFRIIREQDFYYIDNTSHIQQLVDQGRYYFLSRPLRFGKSLLIDTLRELFEGICMHSLITGNLTGLVTPLRQG